jgi:hypothetical protein
LTTRAAGAAKRIEQQRGEQVRSDHVRRERQLQPVDALPAVGEPGTGVVDQDVDLSVALPDGGRERPDRALVGHVHRQHGHRVRPPGAEIHPRGLPAARIPGVDDHPRAEPDEPARDLPAQPRRCAGDHRHGAVKVHIEFAGHERPPFRGCQR